MTERYPNEEELKAIREWPYTDCLGLAEYVKSIWAYNDWATLSDWRKDDCDHEYRELRLATAGWSGNEDIIGALNENNMFSMICWYLSQRGGLHIYHIPRPKSV